MPVSEPESTAADMQRALVRIEELETRSAYQEQMLDELNDTVFRHQNGLDKLEATCRHLLKKLREFEASRDEADDEEAQLQPKPPHY